MESTNNFQHHEQQQEHLQEHFVGCSPLVNHPSSSSSLSPNYGVSSSLLWSNNNILSATTSTDTYCNNFPKNEEDMLSSFTSFTTLINNNNNPTNMMENSCSFNNFAINNHNNNNNINNLHNNTRGIMMNFPIEQFQSSYSDTIPINSWITSNNGFHSSSNILHQLGLVPSTSNSTSVSSSSPRLGLTMEAMDLLGNNASYGSPRVLHDEAFVPSRKNTSIKAIGLTNGIAGTKRAAGSCSSDQSKASTSNISVPNKKSQLKVSCPPLKVRKEKLGDRIAALHQLVSPFGKTDTASVLTEAIGYIQFLQDQIHTLCMPNNAKPSRNRQCKPLQMATENEEDDVKDEDSQIDIRRRGLCIVPVSWTSYITPNQFDASNTPYF
ncbi:hypothetical protein RND81_11G208400 [Saponaria officinalis]|uniref:BHLH domain-containing protein n=1 Tax=Saponaria officinalis TaxID=3572 RepID=A0AAW1HQC3_SAPOF